jgi:hypothetical protein
VRTVGGGGVFAMCAHADCVQVRKGEECPVSLSARDMCSIRRYPAAGVHPQQLITQHTAALPCCAVLCCAMP